MVRSATFVTVLASPSGDATIIGTSLEDGLAIWWEMNEASGDRADSVGSLDLSDSGTVGSGPGVSGGLAAAFVRADSDYLSRASAAALQIGDRNWTAAIWALRTSDDLMALISKGNPNSGTGEYNVTHTGSSVLRWRTRKDAATASLNSNAQFTQDAWHLIGFGHDADNDELFIRIDDNEPTTVAHSVGVNSLANDLEVGAITTLAFWNGLAAKCGVWPDRLLTEPEWALLYNNGKGRSYS